MKFNKVRVGVWLCRPGSVKVSRVVDIDWVNESLDIVPAIDPSLRFTVSKDKFESFMFEEMALTREDDQAFWRGPHGRIVQAPDWAHYGRSFPEGFSLGKGSVSEIKPLDAALMKLDADLPHSHLEAKKLCNHEWGAIQLIFRTVYDCKKCGAHKEDL